MQAIILAGGKGRRLLPYTTVLPKPLMPIGDYPILEIILRQLYRYGFDDIIISTGYLSELICAYITSRNDLNAYIRFSHEKTPLGTIGPIKQIKNLDDNFLVMNGDVLTDLNYADIFAYHTSKEAIATVATHRRDVHIDFGVIQYDKGNRLQQFIEKPTYSYDVSMGVNILSREVLNQVPDGVPFGIDDLMHILTNKQLPAYCYSHQGFWLDIGCPEDYSISVEEFEKNRSRFLI